MDWYTRKAKSAAVDVSLINISIFEWFKYMKHFPRCVQCTQRVAQIHLPYSRIGIEYRHVIWKICLVLHSYLHGRKEHRILPPPLRKEQQLRRSSKQLRLKHRAFPTTTWMHPYFYYVHNIVTWDIIKYTRDIEESLVSIINRFSHIWIL